jgi:DNA primase
MPRNQFIDFKAVKAAITIERVLEHYGLLDKFKRSGDSLNGPCPIHKGDNPTQFRVSVSKNIWHCFSQCKGGGNVLDFIAKMEKMSIHAAALKAVEWFHLESEAMSAKSDERGHPENTPAQKREIAPTPASAVPATPPATETTEANKPLKFRLEKLEREHPYLTERGLMLETIVDFGAGYCAKGMMAGRIAIPIHNPEGSVVAYCGRWPGEPAADVPKYKLPQGFRKSLELFNIDRAIKEPADRPLVIVEGFFDCMKLHQHGCRKVVALMGSSLSATQEELIRKHTTRDTQIVVMLDEDEAGRAGRDDIAVRLAKFAFVKVHVFGQEGQQPEHLNSEEVQEIFADEIQDYSLSVDRIKAYLSQADGALIEKERLLAHQRSEVQKAQAEIDKVYRLYQEGQLDPAGFGKFYKPLEERKKQLEADIPRLQADIDLGRVEMLSAEEVASQAQRLHQLWPTLEPAEKLKIVEALAEKIVVGKDEINITLSYLPPGKDMAKRWRKGWDSNPRLGYPNA